MNEQGSVTLQTYNYMLVKQKFSTLKTQLSTLYPVGHSQVECLFCLPT